MRAVIQRVQRAQVEVGQQTIGAIGQGLLVFLGVCDADTQADVDYMAQKIMALRIFEDEQGKMNRSAADIGGELLIVSQFTLYGDCRKGRRPSFDAAGNPAHAKALYEAVIQACRAVGFKTEHGRFGADMQVSLQNDGPVTLLLDSKKLF